MQKRDAKSSHCLVMECHKSLYFFLEKFLEMSNYNSHFMYVHNETREETGYSCFAAATNDCEIKMS